MLAKVNEKALFYKSGETVYRSFSLQSGFELAAEIECVSLSLYISLACGTHFEGSLIGRKVGSMLPVDQQKVTRSRRA